jgi:hypothetical protein
MATLVQDSGLLGGSSGSTASMTFNVASNFTVGNKVIVCISVNLGGGGATVSSVTIAGTTATKDESRQSDLFRSCYIFSSTVVNSGSTEIVVNFSATPTVTGIALTAHEWTSIGNKNVSANTVESTTTAPNVTSPTTTIANQKVYAVITTTGNPGATTLPSGYTTMYDNMDANPYSVYGSAVYKEVSATGAQDALWTLTNSTSGFMAIATYEILADVPSDLITIGNVTTANVALATSLSVPVPSGGEDGDIFVTSLLHDSAITNANNFTQVASVDSILNHSEGAGFTIGTVLIKEYTGSEGSTFKYDFAASRKSTAVCFLLKGSTKQALFTKINPWRSDGSISADYPQFVMYNKYSNDGNYFNRTLVTFNFLPIYSFGDGSVQSFNLQKYPISNIVPSPGFTVIGTSDFHADTTDSSFTSVAFNNLNRANVSEVAIGRSQTPMQADQQLHSLYIENAFSHDYYFSGVTGEIFVPYSITVTFEPAPITGPKMRMFANGDVQIVNLVEIAGAQNKLYANGTYVCSEFIEEGYY